MGCYEQFLHLKLLFHVFFFVCMAFFFCLQTVHNDISAEYIETSKTKETASDTKAAPLDNTVYGSVWAGKLNKHGFIYTEMSVCTVPKTQNIREGVRWEHGVTVGHQSQIWSLPASWQRFSPWLMFSDDNIWPLKLWLFLAALNGNYCGSSSVGPDQLHSDSTSVPFSLLSVFFCFFYRAALSIAHTSSILLNRPTVCGTYSGRLSKTMG